MALVSGSSAMITSFYGQSVRGTKHATPLVLLAPGRNARRCKVESLYDFREDPIVKEALKEPVAFFGGLLAGVLRLDLDDEPLKGWVEKTAESAGIQVEELDAKDVKDGPEEIVIE